MKFNSMEFEIPLMSFIFILLLVIIFYSKKRVNYEENKAYKIILITSLISSGLDTIVHTISALTTLEQLNTKYYFLVDYINKLVSTSFVIIFTSLLGYVLLISYKKVRENKEILWKGILITNIIFFIIVNFTHVTITEEAFARNTTGPTITLGYLLVAISLIASMIVNIKNFKKNDKRYYTIFLIALIMVFLYILSLVYRGLIIYDLISALLCYIMYFTIENPDMQTINTLLRNKELVEKSVNDKSNLLFRISQEMKKPVKEIIKSTKDYDQATNKEKRQEIINKIQQDANRAYFIINDITDISSMDVKKIKIYQEKYLTEKLFQDIKVITKNKLKTKEKENKIELSFKKLSECPKYLYGDYVKLKQILLSIISNAIQHTEKGFIDIEIEAITRYNIARLIFIIKDSGCGMSIEKINELLETNDDLDIKKFQNKDNLELKLPTVIKILKLLGGSINIKSEEQKGTIITVVIDQKIEENKENSAIKEAKKYNLNVKSRKRVLVATDTNLESIENALSKYDIDIITTLMGKDVIDKINQGDKFDLILLKDELKPESAYTVQKELKKNKKFQTPIIIMIEKDKEFIKEHFIKDGFTDCIVMDDNLNDFKKIVDKYL